MPDLIPSPSPYADVPLELSRMPQNRITAGAVQQQGDFLANSLNEVGAGAERLSNGLKSLDIVNAQKQAATDLLNQKVSIGPDGKPTVLTPQNSVFFGAARIAYDHAIVAGTTANVGATADAGIDAIHQKHLGDPVGQKAADDAYVQSLGQSTDNPIAAQAIVQRARERAVAAENNNTNFTARIDLENQAKSLSAQKSDAEDMLSTLAQSGQGPGDPAFDKAWGQRDEIQKAFAGNILLKTPPDEVARQDMQFQQRIEGEHLVGTLGRIVETQGRPAAVAALDALKESPNLSRADLTRLRTEGNAFIQSVTPAWEAKVAQNKLGAEEAIKALDRGINPYDPMFGKLIQQSLKIGDVGSVNRLRDAIIVKVGLKPSDALPDNLRQELYGSPLPATASPPSRPVTPTPTPPLGSSTHGIPLPPQRPADAPSSPPTPDSAAQGSPPLPPRRDATAPPASPPSASSPAPLPQTDAKFFSARAPGQDANLDPSFGGGLRSALSAAEAATGQQTTITSLRRTNAEQADLYARYKAGAGGLAAPPGKSKHEDGMAADIKPGPVLDWLHQHVAEHPEWGIEFLKGHEFAVDPVHIQASGGGAPHFASPEAEYKAHVAMLESSNGAASANIYGFRQGYDGDINNRADQERNMDARTAQNRTQMAGVLGRAPTPQEAYLAHQQGANGALRLLQNPTQRAGDVVGDAAISRNGGDPNASAGTFAQMWARKYDAALSRSGGVPSANGVPFSPKQVQDNGYYLAEYFRHMAQDPGGSYSAIKSTSDAIIASSKYASSISPEDVAPIAQYFQQHQSEPRAQEMMAATMGAAAAVNAPLGGAAHEQWTNQVANIAANSPDLYQKRLADAALRNDQERQTYRKEQPYQQAAGAGIISPVPPIDPTQPQNVAGALIQRSAAGTMIGKRFGEPPPSLIGKGEIPQMQAILSGPGGAQALGQISQSLGADDLQRLVQEPQVRDSIIAMSHSTDPAKLNSAYSFMDKMARQNPLQFDSTFASGVKDLSIWQGYLSSLSPEDLAKHMQRYNDPSQRTAGEELKKVADSALQTVTADKVVAKFSTGGGPFGTTAQAPVGDPGQIDAKQTLYADYAKAYRDAFADSGNASASDTAAMNAIKTKYSVSPTNGNRVMPYAPERFYPEISGSHDWMARQLDDDVKAALNYHETAPLKVPTARGMQTIAPSETPEGLAYKAPRAIVPDDKTQADIAAGRPPSYHVVIQGQDGRYQTMEDANGTAHRFRFDPTAPQASALQKNLSAQKGYLETQSLGNQMMDAGYGGGL